MRRAAFPLSLAEQSFKIQSRRLCCPEGNLTHLTGALISAIFLFDSSQCTLLRQHWVCLIILNVLSKLGVPEQLHVRAGGAADAAASGGRGDGGPCDAAEAEGANRHPAPPRRAALWQAARRCAHQLLTFTLLLDQI
jgi:hypothetical protein